MNNLHDMIKVSCEEIYTSPAGESCEDDKWAAVEQQHGPLLTQTEWRQHEADYNRHLDESEWTADVWHNANHYE